MNEKRQMEADLRERLLDELFNSNLIAVGFRVVPTTSRGPVSIASEHFYDAEAFWHQDALEAVGYRYERVRVLNPNAADAQAVPRRKIGRPGSREKIVAAIQSQLELDPELGALPRKTACGRVRRQIRDSGFAFDLKNPPKGSGLNDANITKIIVEICGIKAVKY